MRDNVKSGARNGAKAVFFFLLILAGAGFVFGIFALRFEACRQHFPNAAPWTCLFR